MFCPECGYENNDENKFCMKCGKNLDAVLNECKSDNEFIQESDTNNIKLDTQSNDSIFKDKEKDNDIAIDEYYRNHTVRGRFKEKFKKISAPLKDISYKISCFMEEDISHNQNDNMNGQPSNSINKIPQNQCLYPDSNYSTYTNYPGSAPYPFYKKSIYTKNAMIARIIIGVISIVISPFIAFQSYAAGIVGIFIGSDSIVGTAGLFQSIFLLTAGILSITARKTRGGSITASAFYIAASAIGFLCIGIYTDLNISVFDDLKIWSYIIFILGSYSVDTLNKTNDLSEKSEDKKYTIEGAILSTLISIILVLVIIATVKAQ